MHTDLHHELNITRTIAEQAGHIIVSHYNTDYQVHMKAGEEPVTIADRQASQHIVNALQQAFPNDLVLSEESTVPKGVSQSHRVWVIDPMDGTKEFIKHNNEFSVMIGLVREGSPVLGVVYQPLTEHLYWGVKGQGAFARQSGEVRQMHVSKHSQMDELCIAVSRSHLSQELIELYQRMGIPRMLQSGSVGLKLALIAQQVCDVYLNISGMTSCWDTCAPEAILREAGGHTSDLSGKPLDYSFEQLKNRDGVIATNGVVHQKLLSLIQQLLEQHYHHHINRL
jgi:3'(2'), 5'-bisphosphate nucleotidase